MSINVVWFKRDLRLQDHAPLAAAAQDGKPTLLLYIFEPALLGDAHYRDRHWRFVWQSLEDMREKLAAFSLPLVICRGDAVEILRTLHESLTINALLSHEETGLDITFARDRHVAQWCDTQQVRWREFPTNGVLRGLRTRKGWNRQWHQTMSAPQATVDLSQLRAMGAETLALSPFIVREPPAKWRTQSAPFQAGGECIAQATLDSFLSNRASHYATHISKPEASRQSCSRLSPYIAWGNLSIRQVYQALLQRQALGVWPRALSAFESRLHWHCHFIQKFEMECRMEFEDINRGYLAHSRGREAELLDAWKTGHTGYPLIDASMRCLRATGYVNFRSRAMLVSFLCHHLWQDWRTGAAYLGSLFLDFEPGIHYAQMQMQAGVTGINTIRIYNPVKQSQEHDANAVFIKRWCPELEELPTPIVHTPWALTPMEQQMYAVDYPQCIVDTQQSYRQARDKLWALRADKKVLAEKQRILARHIERRVIEAADE